MAVPLPLYPAVRPPEPEDGGLLRDHLFRLQPQVSELCFANLFLFRHAHHYTLSLLDDSVIVFGRDYDGTACFLPPLCGNRGAAARKLLDAGHQLYGADEAFLAEHLTGRGYSLVEDRDNDDYLYLKSDLATLSGARFRTKRNRIQHFTSRHRYVVEPFSSTHVTASLHLLDNWFRHHDNDGTRSLQPELAASREGLERAEELGLFGVVVRLDDGIAAFALGERLNDTTAVCLFEKADPAMDGASQLVNREFCRLLPPECSHVNREQDLGKPGLREAKRSYHPVAMVRKFRVFPRSPAS
ncbi:DUF2156 domain-containing protein [Trichlorobacter ammonificans]|uniref:Phosphatidylglycerol lysyltransferase C-terminal domain-containing protein n=1 Tax=Trichlorobacter ammonificans TaxID=2916410 RepID=A0ABM9DAE2_9BACT|nr:DUF2156 domain-containing protein [Trichlorobacter ammonificans]CAH2031340.1 conserved protein of unknown function [Trichlorobacter ammonificans]